MLLLINLPPTDPAPLADYLPFLNLLRELLREHEDQSLPHPITISVKPGDLVLLKDLLPSPLGPWWTGPHLVILMTPTAVNFNGIPQWQHLLRNGLLASSREHLTVVLLANSHPNAYVLALLFLSLLPCVITSCTSRDINLSKTVWRTAMRAPYCAPCQQEALKRLSLCPHS
jgi:hypothetical protein